MSFKIPSLDETRTFLAALGKALFPSANYGSRRSFHGRRSTYVASAVTQLHSHADSAQRDAHPLTAGDGPPINAWGDAVQVARKGATPARKEAAGRVRGTGGSTVTVGAQLVDPASGLFFLINSSVTIPGAPGVDGFFDADIVADESSGSVGSQTRLAAGTVLNFVGSAPAGIQSSVVLQLDLDEDGFDAEPFGGYRARVLATFSQPTSGGNQADFVKWALASLNTITSAFCYPERAGRGTVDVAVFYNGSGTARAVTLADRDTVAAYIQTQAPFQISGIGGGLRLLTTIADPQPVEILIETSGQSAFTFDWDDSSNPTVAAWQPGGVTNKLQFAATLPASLRAGHRIVLVGVATAQDGREFTVESIAGSDSVILAADPPVPVAPVATDKIYSGGPVVTPIRNAIVAHLDGQIVYAGRGLTPLPASTAESSGVSIIGLDILAEGIGPANPAGKYNSPNGPTWSGGILRAALFSIAKYQNGVRNVTVTTPSSDYEALDDPFPTDNQIHYVTPGAVVVRSA